MNPTASSMSTKESIKQGIRELVQGGNTTAYSKDFFEFVKHIGDARTKQDEDRIIQNEIRTLKQKMSSKDLQQKYMKEYLIRMLYVEMLGHDASFGHINAVNMVSSRNLLEKRIGYLAVSLVLHPEHQLMILLVNAFQTDLKSDNYLEVCMALHAVTKLCNVDFIPAVMPHVLTLLTHKQAIVRKKAVVCLQRFYSLQPSSISGLNDLILKALCDPDPSVMAAALLVLKEVVPSATAEYKMIIPSLVTILKQIIEHRLPREYDYHRLPAPWIQMNILQLISTLCQGDRKSSELVFDLLSDVLKRAAISSNIGYSIVYQCIRTITNIYPNTSLLKSAAEAVTFFLSSPFHNLKYLGLTSLAAIIKVDPSHAADHQLVVIDCLQSRDETLQHKTLELLYHMTNPTNVIAIVDTMIKYLKLTTNSTYRGELCLKILDLCDLYAPNGAWYVLTISSLYEIGGDDIPQHKTYSVINFLTSLIDETDEENIEIRKGLTNEFISKLQAADTTVSSTSNNPTADGKQPVTNNVIRIPESFLKTIAWVLGEFGIVSGFDGNDIIDLLSSRLIQTYIDSSVRHWILRAIMRVVSQLPPTGTLSQTTLHIINNAKQSQDVSLQQIALEMDALYKHRAFLSHVLVAPTLSLQVDPDLAFLKPLVDRALQSGACGKYIPNYLDQVHNSSEKQTKSGLRFEAYAKATPLVRIQPVHAPVTAPVGTNNNNNNNNNNNIATPNPAVNPAQPAQPDGKINLKLGGAKGSWGPKGFNNPTANKAQEQSQNQGPVSHMVNSDAQLSPQMLQAQNSAQAGFLATARPADKDTGNMFGGMIRPKPRASEIASQQAEDQKKQHAARGLFAGLTPKPAVTGTKAAPAAPEPQSLTTPAKKFAFKSNVSIKKTGTATSGPLTNSQTHQQQSQASFFAEQTQPTTTTATTTATTNTNAGAALDLFDFGAPAPAPAPGTSQQPANNAGDINDLLFGLSPQTSQKPTPTTTPKQSGGFDILSSFSSTPSQAPPTTSTASPSTGFDLFDFASPTTSTPAQSTQPSAALAVGFASNMSTLDRTVNATVQNLPIFQHKTSNPDFTISTQNVPQSGAMVIWISNAATQTRHARESIKIQLQSGVTFDTTKSVLIDNTAQQTVTGSQQGQALVFNHTSSPTGVGSLVLVLYPQSMTKFTPSTLHFTVGTSTTSATDFFLPVSPSITPLQIETAQYGSLWKAFGTTGEFKTTLAGTSITSPDQVPALLQKARIHRVQTIKQETIAAAIPVGQTAAQMNDLGVLLHVKVIGDGSVSLHCRSKWSQQAAQQFVESFALFVQGKY